MKTTETDKDSRQKLLENPEIQDIMVSLLRSKGFPLHCNKKLIVEEFVAHELSKLNDPTITTHDGVIIKLGQTAWTINWIKSGPQILSAEISSQLQDRTWFSTKAAAEAHLETLFEGYLAPFDMWRGRIKKGDLFLFKLSACGYNCNGLYLPAEIVTTWEKKYRKP